MTIPSNPASAGPYSTDGTTTAFPFTYKSFGVGYHAVVKNTGGVLVGLVYGSDFAVTQNADQDANPGGNVLISPALPAGSTLSIYSNVPYEQPTQFPTGGRFFASVVMDALDRVVTLIKQSALAASGGTLLPSDRSLRVPSGETINELPLAAGRANKILVFDNNGNVTTGDSAGSAATLLADLADTDDLEKGDALLGVKMDLTGAAARTQHAKNADFINVKDFGAVGDGDTDDTAAIQAAITAAGAEFSADWFTTVGAYAAPRVVDFPSSIYKILGTLLLPKGVTLQGNRSTLLGSGFTGSDNVAIEGGYFSGANVVTNIGTANETQRLVASRVTGFRFVNFKTAINAFNWNEVCSVDDNTFYNCRQAIIAKRCFYSRWVGNISRGSAGAAALPCVHFDDAVNAMIIESNFVVDRALAFEFTGLGNGVTVRGNSAESCTNGFRFTGSMSPSSFTDNYFEAVSGIAVEFVDGVIHYAPTISGNFFNACGTGIKGRTVLGGKVDDSNLFVDCTTVLDFSDVLSSIEVSILPANMGAGVPALPAGYLLGPRVRTSYPLYLYDGGTTDVQIRADHTESFAQLPFTGRQGYVPATIPFCTVTPSGTTNMVLYIQTQIVYDPHLMTIYSLEIADEVGTYAFAGRTYGTVVMGDVYPGGGKNIGATDNSGFLLLTITGLTHASGICNYAGIVRMI